jgi:hypothetical protein
MLRHLQAVRIRMNNGQEVLFFGPTQWLDGQSLADIEDIEFVSELECNDTLTANDIWLLTQPSGTAN